MNKKIAGCRLDGLLKYLLTRLKLRFFDRLSRKGKGKTINVFDHEVELDLSDLEQKYLAADCVREPENLFVYRAIAKGGIADSFIDIGANCGHVAASIVSDFSHLLLIEPNPKLAVLLSTMFKDVGHVQLRDCAIVNEESVGICKLTVPDTSSGFATLGGTHLSKLHERVQEYDVRASTLLAEVSGFNTEKVYIKIDVEGFEAKIIESAKEFINKRRCIVGFEALSAEAAVECVELFENYVFYCARFDFLESGGALSKSALQITKALVSGGNMEILKLSMFSSHSIDNFSQIFSVPAEKALEFEKALNEYSKLNPVFDLAQAKTWSR